MVTISGREPRAPITLHAVPWRSLAVALVFSLGSTLILGGWLLFLLDNIWWGAAVGVAALFGGGFYVSDSVGEAEPMYGSMLTGGYFAVVVTVIFAGTALELFADPYPGLQIGNSTFFFVAPLLLLAGGVAGSVVGGQTAIQERDVEEAEMTARVERDVGESDDC